MVIEFQLVWKNQVTVPGYWKAIPCGSMQADTIPCSCK